MTLLSVRGLGKTFARGGRRVAALADVDLDLAAGETLAVVGASGSLTASIGMRWKWLGGKC